MATKVRKGLRETNSSSTHVIAFTGRKDIKLPNSIKFKLSNEPYEPISYLYTCIFIKAYNEIQDHNTSLIEEVMDKGSFKRTNTLEAYQNCIKNVLAKYGIKCSFGTYHEYSLDLESSPYSDSLKYKAPSITGEMNDNYSSCQDYKESDEWELIRILLGYFFSEDESGNVFIKNENEFLDFLMTGQVGCVDRDYKPFVDEDDNYKEYYTILCNGIGEY